MMASIAILGCLVSVGSASAQSDDSVAGNAMAAFSSHCFSPFMTAKKAQQVLGQTGVRYDFYDLDPFSSAPPSPAVSAPVTEGTDRRCEVSFDGGFGTQAKDAVMRALAAEGIDQAADVPAQFASSDGTYLLAARQLNPRRVAVVHVGTRAGENGIETFMLVERLLPTKGQD